MNRRQLLLSAAAVAVAPVMPAVSNGGRVLLEYLVAEMMAMDGDAFDAAFDRVLPRYLA